MASFSVIQQVLCQRLLYKLIQSFLPRLYLARNSCRTSYTEFSLEGILKFLQKEYIENSTEIPLEIPFVICKDVYYRSLCASSDILPEIA